MADRDKTLQMRVTDEEYNIINDKAKQLGLSTSNYMRMVCLHSKFEILIKPESTNIDNDN